MNRRLVAPAIVVVLVVAACSALARSSVLSETASPGASAANLTVYAAASLQDALARAATSYEAAHPGVHLTISTGSSAALETQIEQGAPADLFLSADTANPDRLVAHGLADGAPVAFARNELVVVVPAANPAGIATAADLARPGLKIVAAGPAVPITKYAERLVANLAATPGFPAGFADRYGANVVSREDDVRAVLAKIELGEGDAAIVYATDARSTPRVRTVPLPASANVPATYAGVVVKGSTQAAVGRAFLQWLAGSDGQALLAGFGFAGLGALPPR